MLLVGFTASACSSGSSTPTDQTSTTVATNGSLSGSSSSFDRIPDIVQNVAPSTVSIHANVGNGSGVVWDDKGNIVTNEHVIRDATTIAVSFADGTHAAAKLVADDPITDLAVLHVDRPGLPPAHFASALPRVGALAIAMGNPLGFANTVSAGIVSSLNRNIPGSAATSQALVDLIQTDAPISPGNSGGALLDDEGRVMGINVAYIPPEARAVSIGFAIPSATVTNVVRQLLQTGTVSHAFMGMVPTTLTAQVRDSLGVHATSGVVVSSVVTGGPAANAGIKPGDVLTAIGSTRVASEEQFLSAMRGHRPGDVVDVTVIRGTATKKAKVTLTGRPMSG